MTTLEELRRSTLFDGLDDEQLAEVIEQGSEVRVPQGEIYAREGDPIEHLYVMLEGELRILKQVYGREMILNTYSPGVFFGEVPLLAGKPFLATGRALTDCRLFRLPQDVFWRMLNAYPSFSKAVLETMARRVNQLQSAVRQRQQLESLGTLAAGLAHELNNPAAASVRAAGRLRECFESLRSIGMEVSRLASSGSLDEEEVAGIERVSTSALAKAGAAEERGPLEHSEREENMALWMEGRGVEEAWDYAATFAEAGLDVGFLEDISGVVGSGCIGEALRYQEAVLAVAGLVEEVEASTTRVSGLVETMKAYSHMDQAPLREVDVNEEIENTLAILAYRLDGVEVERDYGELPPITAYGGELNQVWTSLLENAVDALAGEGAGRVRVRTRCENDQVLVQVEDDGPGVPAGLQTRIFEPFFTTKGVGEGTGLGLDVSYRIVGRHNGDIRVVPEIQTGTCIEVLLPVGGPDSEEPVDQPLPTQRVSG
ncbi:MAG: sensor histidine kinase [Rubrobacteraceae bacterium]